MEKMNLNTLLLKPLKECLMECNIVKYTLISNEKGDIKIIIEYVPNNRGENTWEI